MKSFKTMVLASIALLLLNQSVFAAPKKSDLPTECPATADLINGGLGGVYTDNGYSYYIVGQIANYNTPYQWGFGVLVNFSQASSEEEAMLKAEAALPTLTGTPDPVMIDNEHVACMYNISKGYYAGAVAPIDFLGNMAKMLLH